MTAGHAREEARQRWLLERLATSRGAQADDWLQPGRRDRGLLAHEAHAAAVADRALAARYPTVQAMLGGESFANLARVLWSAQPPVRGDLAEWGHALPAFLAADAALRDWPYLADCARLDGALADCANAADGHVDHASLALLGQADPADIQLRLAPGVSVVCSRFPIVTLWRAHAVDGGLRTARDALAAGAGECALVWRGGWRAQATAVSADGASFTASLRRGLPLGAALDLAGTGFDFEAWLVQALAQGWLLGANARSPANAPLVPGCVGACAPGEVPRDETLRSGSASCPP